MKNEPLSRFGDTDFSGMIEHLENTILEDADRMKIAEETNDVPLLWYMKNKIKHKREIINMFLKRLDGKNNNMLYNNVYLLYIILYRPRTRIDKYAAIRNNPNTNLYKIRQDMTVKELESLEYIVVNLVPEIFISELPLTTELKDMFLKDPRLLLTKEIIDQKD